MAGCRHCIVYGTAGVGPGGPYQRVAVDIGDPPLVSTYGYPPPRASPNLMMIGVEGHVRMPSSWPL